MWIANGFIQLDSITISQRLEDIASEWFDELVNMAFLWPTIWKTGYIMHDLVRDFAIALSSNKFHGIKTVKDASQILHYLSVEMGDSNVQLADFEIEQWKPLMLFTDFGQSSSIEAYHSQYKIQDSPKSLCILDFSCGRWCGTTGYLDLVQGAPSRPPDAISRLKHLRYLDLSYTGINVLPDSVCSLCHLQVLGLQGCRFLELPRNMNSLMNLRHLHADPDTTSQVYGIGKLTKLQELNKFHVKVEDGHRITELSDLNDIRGFLCIPSLDMLNDPEEALQANIVGKSYLTSLRLEWSRSPTKLAMEILGNLSPRNLRELELFGYPGLAFPDWVGQLKYVRVVEIRSCFKLRVLPPLGQLEHLQKLTLFDLPSIRDINSEVYGTSNVIFRSLEELTFGGMYSYKSWTYAGCREFIPNLRKLWIFSCPNLRKVPFEFLGSAAKDIFFDQCSPHAISRYLQRLTGLTRLEIHNSYVESGTLTLPCEQLTCLEYLFIGHVPEVCIKGGLWFIKSLTELRISNCDRITTEIDEESQHVTSKSARVMHSLTHFGLDKYPPSTDLNNILSRTPSLRTLCLFSIRDFTSIIEQWLQQLTSLQEMALSVCHSLPSSLAVLSSLRELTLNGCNQIHSIPPNGLPRNLKQLQIGECSVQLEARCKKGNGKVWPKEEEEEWRRAKMEGWRRAKMERWRRAKMEEWLGAKMELGWMKQEQKGSQDKWLQLIDQNEWPGPGWKGDEWLREKMEELLISNEEGPSSLQKERDEWLKQEEQKFLELRAQDWPNIAHVPYIHINGKIVQNLYT